MNPDGFISPHGNYRALKSFQKSELIYDITFRFCHKNLSRGDRTVDQMIQAARSGKQNIIEACKASGTSKQTEIKLLGVARASLEELLADYSDYLRVRDHLLWDKNGREALYVRHWDSKFPTPLTYDSIREILDNRPAEVISNVAICLIHQANFLLDQQIRRAEIDFVKNGGVREQMTQARLRYRSKGR